jgi:hypothetical protein
MRYIGAKVDAAKPSFVYARRKARCARFPCYLTAATSYSSMGVCYGQAELVLYMGSAGDVELGGVRGRRSTNSSELLIATPKSTPARLSPDGLGRLEVGT